MTTLLKTGAIAKRGSRRSVVSAAPAGAATIVPAGKVLGTKTVKVKKLRRPAAERILAITKAAEAVDFVTGVIHNKKESQRIGKKVITASYTLGSKARKSKGEMSKVINLDTFLKPVSGKKVIEAARRIYGYDGKELLKP